MTESIDNGRQTIIQRLRLIHISDPRVFSWALLLVAVLATVGVTQATRIRSSIIENQQTLAQSTTGQFTYVLTILDTFDQSLADAKSQGVDASSVEALRPQVISLLMQGEYADAALNLANLTRQLQALRDAKSVADQAAAEAARLSAVNDLVLTVPPSAPTSSTPPPASGGSSGSSSDSSTSDGNSSYSLKTVGTSRGDFAAHVMTFNLSAGARVKTATGNDDDCSNNCAVQSLSGYVNEEGGSSGINGTYFCPPDYGATCDGQVNAYFWKVYKTSLGKLINGTNGLGNLDPMIAFTSGGHAQYFSTWDSWKNSGFATYAGMNSKPRLVEGGSNILNEGDLDSNQKTVKGNRGAIGLSGQTFWAVIVKSATVPDLAAVMDELGVEYAMNIDGGGSSAMIYEGSYKVGPGRAIPNAVVIVH